MIPRILIVDDEALAVTRLTTLLSDIAHDCPHQLVGTATDALDALEQIALHTPDIILLDVQMPGMTGVELARHLANENKQSPAVIFVTAYDEFALKAFEVHALDYLVKPVRAARLSAAISRAYALKVAGHTHPSTNADVVATLKTIRKNFVVHERGRLLLVPVKDVIYLKAETKYITLRTASRDYLIEESLSSLEKELSAHFIRVHRNALVSRLAIIGVERGTQADFDAETNNALSDKTLGDQALSDQASYDKRLESWQVILAGINDRLPVSRRQWANVKALIK